VVNSYESSLVMIHTQRNPSVFALLLVPLRYVSNRQIHEDLDVPLFADHIRALTASFDSKLAVVENPLVRQLCRHCRLTESRVRRLTREPRAAGASRLVEAHRPRWPSRPNESRSALISLALFGYSD